jgi:hypothetical protein
MNAKIQCAAPHCGRLFDPNPRVKNQRYCAEKSCQRARKGQWQKEKLTVDPDYKANQRDCQIDWHTRHPGYYRKYRQEHPRYCQRNTLLQRGRNAKARVIATMDASVQKVLLIPIGYDPLPVIANEDSIAPPDLAC